MSHTIASLLTLLVVTAESNPAPNGGQQTPQAEKEAAPVDGFVGFSIAASATDVLAPESGFRLAGWQSDRGRIKLMEIVDDGTEVKSGDVVARFEFQARDALQKVEEKIQSTEAAATQARLNSQQAVDALVLQKRKLELSAKVAQLNVDKENAISKRQADVYRIAKRIAEFEVTALQSRLESAERENIAEREYQDLLVARAKSDLERYAFYERRSVVKAPHDGVVRHAFNNDERRKVQNGDALSAGGKVLALAKDQKLAARFFVPEHRLHEIGLGNDVTVIPAGSAQELHGRVTSIEYFPQEMGFLLESWDRPNAREKAFAVKAELLDAPTNLAAGTELFVKPASGSRAARSAP